MLFSFQLVSYGRAELSVSQASVHDNQDFSGEGPAAKVLEEPLKKLVECFLRTDFLMCTS